MMEELIVAKALKARATELEAEAEQMMATDYSARKAMDSPAMLVLIKQQVAQELRAVAAKLDGK